VRLHLYHPEVCFSIWPTVTGKCPDPVSAAEVILTEAALWLGHLPAQGPDRLLTPRVLDSCTEAEMEAVLVLVWELGRKLEQDLSLWAVPGTPPEISNFSKQPGKKYQNRQCTCRCRCFVPTQLVAGQPGLLGGAPGRVPGHCRSGDGGTVDVFRQ
jgi:hypothetical protein